MEYIDKQYVFKYIQSVSDAIRGMETNLIKEKFRMEEIHQSLPKP